MIYGNGRICVICFLSNGQSESKLGRLITFAHVLHSIHSHGNNCVSAKFSWQIKHKVRAVTCWLKFNCVVGLKLYKHNDVIWPYKSKNGYNIKLVTSDEDNWFRSCIGGQLLIEKFTRPLESNQNASSSYIDIFALISESINHFDELYCCIRADVSSGNDLFCNDVGLQVVRPNKSTEDIFVSQSITLHMRISFNFIGVLMNA